MIEKEQLRKNIYIFIEFLFQKEYELPQWMKLCHSDN